MIDFSQVYKTPFKLRYMKVLTADNKMAFDFYFNKDIQGGENPLIISDEIKKDILDKINGVSNFRITANLHYKDSIIYLDNREFISIRGWGHLTGVGGLKLDDETARKIQDEFAYFIIKQLKLKQ